MKKFPWSIVVLLGLLLGCSSDTEPVETGGDTTNDRFSFTVIGEDNENLYQFDFDSEITDRTPVNLSTELNIDGVFLTLRQVDEVLSFFSFSRGNFSFALKNLNSEAVTLFPDFYTNTPERSIVWGTNSLETIHFGFYAPSGSSNLALRSIDIPSFEGDDLALEFNVTNLYQPLLVNDKLFITYRTAGGQFKVATYDIATKNLIGTLDFADFSPSLFIDDSQNLAVIKSNVGTEAQLELYDFDSLELLDSRPLGFTQFFDPGELDAELIDGKLYYSAAYAQPSPVTFGPAIFDTETGTNDLLGFIDSYSSVQTNLQTNLTLTAQGYSAAQNLFFIGFVDSNSATFDAGGVMVIAADGTLLDTIEVPFAPIYFVKD
ncbi:hypothetical protein ABV409_03680 [Flagellimonas sp. DF-77]|uniref:hypothetical protein n=1 Tax=Flagellimonas algarum TaxID=3230298 RepID=UPI00339636F6